MMSLTFGLFTQVSGSGPLGPFVFCCERDFMLSLSEDNQSDVIEAFNSTSRYVDDLLNIDNNFFDSMVNRIYPSEIQLNKANVSFNVEAGRRNSVSRKLLCTSPKLRGDNCHTTDR